MACAARSGTVFVAGMFLIASLATAARAQSSQYPKPGELPNPYRLVEGWPTLPENMLGRGHPGACPQRRQYLELSRSNASFAAS
jgi:hypothetical protein